MLGSTATEDDDMLPDDNYTDDAADAFDLQGQVEAASTALATLALLNGPAACGRTASDLFSAVEEAVRLIAANPAARPVLAKAVAEHVQGLAVMTRGWVADR